MYHTEKMIKVLYDNYHIAFSSYKRNFYNKIINQESVYQNLMNCLDLESDRLIGLWMMIRGLFVVGVLNALRHDELVAEISL